MLTKKEQNELYYKHKTEIMSVIKRQYVNYDHNIIYNNTMISAFKNYDKLKNKDMFKSWLYKIAMRKGIEQVRANKIYNQRHFLTITGEDRGYIDNYDKIANDEYIQNLIKLLPTQKHIDIFTDFIEGYSHKELGKKYNIAEGTSKWFIFDSRRIINSKIQLNNWMSRY